MNKQKNINYPVPDDVYRALCQVAAGNMTTRKDTMIEALRLGLEIMKQKEVAA